MPEKPDTGERLEEHLEANLSNAMEGETSLKKPIEELNQTCKDFIAKFNEKNPDKRYFYMRVGDRASESGYREVEFRIENDGSYWLTANTADLSGDGKILSRTTHLTYTEKPDSGDGLTIIELDINGEKRRLHITRHNSSGDEAPWSHTPIGSPITATTLAGAAREDAKLINYALTISNTPVNEDKLVDEIIISDKPPERYRLGGPVDPNPKAPFN
jgi:hypothetical protein